MWKKALLILCLSFNLGCSAQIKVEDQQIGQLITAYQQIFKMSPKLAESMKNGGFSLNSGEQLKELEKVIQNAGFEDLGEFAKVNGAVAWAYAEATGNDFMKFADQQVRHSIQRIEQDLKNPKTSAKVKAQLKTQKENIIKEYEKNKPMAKVTMDMLGKMVDKNTIEVVKRHQKELGKLFSGELVK